MTAERRQPFKQLFRELYTLNENERDEAGLGSRRYVLREDATGFTVWDSSGRPVLRAAL